MPCPYNIILGRETALPCPLDHSGVTGFDIMRPGLENSKSPNFFAKSGL
jgi:hypothetical protein